MLKPKSILIYAEFITIMNSGDTCHMRILQDP
jgi:hypothetical protein